MKSEMEKIFVAKISRHAEIDDNFAAKTIFVSFAESEIPKDFFEDIVWNISPPIVKNGAAVLSGTNIQTPNGALYFSIECSGSIEDWRTQIVQGAQNLGRKSAVLSGNKFIVCNKKEYPLDLCKITRN